MPTYLPEFEKAWYLLLICRRKKMKEKNVYFFHVETPVNFFSEAEIW